MSREPDTYEVRLTSRRAPYRRAGVVFASTRTAVVIPADDLTDDQLDRLSADPVITIEVIDIATGDVVALQTEGAVIGIAPVAPGEGEGDQAGAGNVSPAPVTSPASPATDQPAAPVAEGTVAPQSITTPTAARKAKR